MSKIRVATLGLASVVVLAWAVPAFAHHSKAAATVTVTEGKPAPSRSSCRRSPSRTAP